MTLEGRVEALENTSNGQEARIRLLELLAERSLDLIEEIRRDNQQTQRLWVRLAQRYGWLDEDDLLAD